MILWDDYYLYNVNFDWERLYIFVKYLVIVNVLININKCS